MKFIKKSLFLIMFFLLSETMQSISGFNIDVKGTLKKASSGLEHAASQVGSTISKEAKQAGTEISKSARQVGTGMGNIINKIRQSGYVQFTNRTSNMSLQFKYQETNSDKHVGWSKKIGPNDSWNESTERALAAPDIKDLWVRVFNKDKHNEYLGNFKFTKNINIKNNKKTRVEFNWNGNDNILIRKVYKPGENNLDYTDQGTMGLLVFNKSKKTIYVATYRKIGSDAKRVGNVFKIDPGKFRQLPKLGFQIGSSRKLIYSYFKKNLPKKIGYDVYKNRPHHGIGIINHNYYIAEYNSRLTGYTSKEWATRNLNPNDMIFEALKKAVQALDSKYPHSKEIATVFHNKGIPAEEKKFLKKRKLIASKALSNVLNSKITPNNVPIIACAHSGGGFRAAISSTGILTGLEDIGLLDSISYLAGISGSTWAFSTFAYYQETAKNYKKMFGKKVKTSTFFNVHDFSLKKLLKVKFLTNVIQKIIWGQHINVIDFEGAILDKKFYEQLEKYKSDNIYLSDFPDRLKDAKTPMPILTAISPGISDDSDGENLWFEFTPYDIGVNVDDFYIPTWSFDRKFVNGKSTNFAKEENVGFLMGIWGSAIADSKFQDMLGFLENIKLKKLEDYIDTTPFGKQRLWPAKINNPFFALNNYPRLNSFQRIMLVDAGAGLRFPIPPLLRRRPNIIFLYDADANKDAFGRSLFSTKEWADKHDFKFPEFIKNENEIEKNQKNKTKKEIKDENNNIKGEISNKIKDNPVQIFESSDPNIPTIIYFAFAENPRYKNNFDTSKAANSGFCQTLHFKYSQADFNRLTGLMHSHVVDNKDRIIAAIRRKVNQLNK